MQKKYDFILLITTVLLTIIGLVVLQAINFRDPSLAAGFNPVRQIAAAIIGFTLLILAARTDYRLWLRLAPVWYLVGLGLLVLLLFVGETVAGSTRGIDLGFIEFQPTEIAKLGLILILARLYATYFKELAHPKFILISLLFTGVVAVLVLLQPDMGSIVVLMFIWLVMTLMSNVRKPYLIGLILVAIMVMPFALGQLQPYQQERLQTFMDPTADPQGSGYNVNQATIAIGSGQIFGRGLSGGTQSQLNFLPSQHTDFVFAVLAEKLGLLGAVVVIVLFMVLLFRGFYIAVTARDRFGSLLASGIMAMFLVQIVITIGMNLGIAPVTGLPLPFIAYGGTSLIISLFAVGILESVAAHKQKLEFKS